MAIGRRRGRRTGNKQESPSRIEGHHRRQRLHSKEKPLVTVDILIQIPRHSSVLSHPCFRQRRLISAELSSPGVCDARNEHESECEHCDEISPSSLSPLNLHLECYHPGVLWRGLLPMLFSSSNDAKHDEKATTLRMKSSSAKTRNAEQWNGTKEKRKRSPRLEHMHGSEMEVAMASTKNINTTSILPQRMVLGLGLVDALRSQLRTSRSFCRRYYRCENYSHVNKQTRNHLSRSSQDNGNEKIANTFSKTTERSTTTGKEKYTGYQEGEQEEPKSEGGNDNKAGFSFASELFYERKIAFPLASFDHNGIKGDYTDRDYAASAFSSATSSNNNSTTYYLYMYIYPPLLSRSDIDRTTFAAIVSNAHRRVLFQKTYSAWLSTLGGGYFGIKDLAHSLWLSRQQRNLAVEVGDIYMAQQCTINEAYNWMYAGRFRLAATVLRNLEEELSKSRRNVTTAKDEGTIGSYNTRNNISKHHCCYTTSDEKILQQCQIARQLLRRLKKTSRNGLEKYHKNKMPGSSSAAPAASTTAFVSRTVDDFQRLRIVPC